jgi:hypothetical protein
MMAELLHLSFKPHCMLMLTSLLLLLPCVHPAVDVIKSAMMTDSIDPAQRKYPTIPSTAKVR